MQALSNELTTLCADKDRQLIELEQCNILALMKQQELGTNITAADTGSTVEVLQELVQQYEAEIATLQAANRQLESKYTSLEQKRDIELRTLVEQHDIKRNSLIQQLAELTQDHDTYTCSLRQQHENELKSTVHYHDNKLNALTTQREADIEGLQAQHGKEIYELRREHEVIIAALTEQKDDSIRQLTRQFESKEKILHKQLEQSAQQRENDEVFHQTYLENELVAQQQRFDQEAVVRTQQHTNKIASLGHLHDMKLIAIRQELDDANKTRETELIHEHSAQVTKLRMLIDQHETEIATLKECLEESRLGQNISASTGQLRQSADLCELEAKHISDICALNNSIVDSRQCHLEEISSMEKQHEGECRTLGMKHESDIYNLQCDNEATVARLTQQLTDNGHTYTANHSPSSGDNHSTRSAMEEALRIEYSDMLAAKDNAMAALTAQTEIEVKRVKHEADLVNDELVEKHSGEIAILTKKVDALVSRLNKKDSGTFLTQIDNDIDSTDVCPRAVDLMTISPNCLSFTVGNFMSEDMLTIHNTSSTAVAYRTRVSVQNMFVVKGGDGVLEGNQTCRVVISTKPTTIYESSEDIPAVKFAIEFLELDYRYDELGSKTFWKRYSPEGVRRAVLTTFQVSLLKPIKQIKPIRTIPNKKRSSSPNRVSWADESPDETEVTSTQSTVVAVSPSAAKHKKHIEEMESILNDLKGQLAKDVSVSSASVPTNIPRGEGESGDTNDADNDAGEVNIEAILKIGSALLNKSVNLINEDDPTTIPGNTTQSNTTTAATIAPTVAISTDREHRDSNRFQPKLNVVTTNASNPAAAGQPIVSPKAFSKPRGRLFDLMIKNVSRDQLLTEEEAEELKQIRELMTKAHWDEWLRDARIEKKKRLNSRSNSQSSPTVTTTSTSLAYNNIPVVPTAAAAPAKPPSPKAPTHAVKKASGLSKKSIKSINRLVKKQEADASIGVLKNALEHLWTKVVDGANSNQQHQQPTSSIPVPVNIHPLETPTIDTAFETPTENARSIFSDIQARIYSHNPADKEGLADRLSLLEGIISGLDSTRSSASNPQHMRSFSNDIAAPHSVLSNSPAFQNIYRQDNGPASSGGDFFERQQQYPGNEQQFDNSAYDDNLGLHTPLRWKTDERAGLGNISFDGNASVGMPFRSPSAGRKHTTNNPSLSASLPVPRAVSTGRSQSAPRVRPKATTPLKASYAGKSGKSISQQLRSGHRTGQVDRWCLIIGNHLKAFDDYPIRVDTQVATVDVVWREKRYEMGGMWQQGDPLSRGASVLRRERFQFDDMFWGTSGGVKLGGNCRQRAIVALKQNIDLCFVCLAAGDISEEKKSVSLMEPPVALLLGDQGGQGLVSSVVDEMFRYLGQTLQPPSYVMPSTSSSHGRAAAQSMQTSGVTAAVVLSAVMLCNGHISDLLAAPGSTSGGPPTVKRLQDGRNILYNVGRLRLHSASDFERVAGVLLGRRSALRQNNKYSETEHIDVHTAVAADENACMLLTLSVTGFGLSNSGEGNYHFVCPCSEKWRLPGAEICMLSEAISALPHPSPPSLVESSLLVQLLTDPTSRTTDFISVNSVVRANPSSNNVQDGSLSPVRTAPVDGTQREQMVQESLQALRVVTRLSML